MAITQILAIESDKIQFIHRPFATKENIGWKQLLFASLNDIIAMTSCMIWIVVNTLWQVLFKFP